MPYSEYFGASNWTKTNVAVTDNATTSPEGVDNAVQITESASGLNVYAPSDTLSGSASSYTYSAFLKQGSLRYGGIRAIVNGFANRFFVNVDLQEGTITDTDTTGTGVTWSYDIEDYGSGWYRVWISGTNTSGNIDLAIGLSNSATPTFLSGLPYYTGTGSDYIYAYGAQVEQGSYPTSYIPNHSGGSVTRGGESSSVMDVPNFTGNPSVSLFADLGEWKGSDINNSNIYLASSSFSQQIQIRLRPDGMRVYLSNINGTDQYLNLGITTALKMLVKYDGNEYVLFINGVKIQTAASVGDSKYEKLYFNGYSTTLINQLLLFPTALTDSECIALTTL